MHPSTTTPTLFERAARVFDGWTDPDTGVRVLRVMAKNAPPAPGQLATVYHQRRCFLGDGQKVQLYAGQPLREAGWPFVVLLDLATGEITAPFPHGDAVFEVTPHGTTLLMHRQDGAWSRYLYDLNTGQELARLTVPGWQTDGCSILADGRRAVIAVHRCDGARYESDCVSRLYLLAAGREPQLLDEIGGCYCNHVMACPADPELFAYDAWPSPRYDIDQVIRVRSLDGRIDQPAALDERAPRPGNFWSVRDHYVWTPDGRRIVSYLAVEPIDMQRVPFNHFTFDWWLTALDWRTGEDYAAQYPPGRWGGHMQVTPDSRYILCAGGPGFDYLFAVEVDGLRRGWNERIICAYPHTVSAGTNDDGFAMPFALPDGSGVLFTAGWPGEEHGVYLAEWPGDA